MWFSQVEYDRHLVDNQWSLKETQYLFSLLAKYDLRFVVVADRYDFQDNSNKTIKRTIEVREQTLQSTASILDG